MAAVGRFRTFSEFCRMLNFIYKCALRTERDREGHCTEKHTRRKAREGSWVGTATLEQNL